MRERASAFNCEGETLVGILHEPLGKAQELGVVVVVGGPQYRVGSHRQFVLMARDLAKAGHAVFRFDFRGMGDSSGQPRTFESVDQDIRAAVDAFTAQVPTMRGVALFGLCDAASAALMYCRSDERVRALILANPWVRTDGGMAKAIIRHRYGRRILQRQFWIRLLRGEVRVREAIADLVGSIRRTMSAGSGASLPGEAYFLTRMDASFAAFCRPILFLVSERDLTAREFDDRCRQSTLWRHGLARDTVELCRVPEADHTFSTKESLEAATQRVLAWLAKIET